MISKILFYGALAGLILHGLIHLMGFVAFWPLAKVADLPYRTALLAGRWEVGQGGMRLFGLLWLAAALGFLLSAAGILLRQPGWRALLISTALFSTVIIALDWHDAFRGAIINAVILLLTAAIAWVPGLFSL